MSVRKVGKYGASPRFYEFMKSKFGVNKLMKLLTVRRAAQGLPEEAGLLPFTNVWMGTGEGERRIKEDLGEVFGGGNPYKRGGGWKKISPKKNEEYKGPSI